jgi:hypothetical protein
VRNGGDKLRWRERLRQHDAVRDAFGRPIFSVFAAHIDDRKFGVDFSRVSGDIPAVDLVWSEINVCDQCSIFPLGSVKQLNGIFTGRSCRYLESPIRKVFFDDAPDKMVVLDDQDNQHIFHAPYPRIAPNKTDEDTTRERVFSSESYVQK